jgi:hypothetical protein
MPVSIQSCPVGQRRRVLPFGPVVALSGLVMLAYGAIDFTGLLRAQKLVCSLHDDSAHAWTAPSAMIVGAVLLVLATQLRKGQTRLALQHA